MLGLRRARTATLLALASFPPPLPAAPSPLAGVLENVGRYSEAYEKEFSNIVAEEASAQTLAPIRNGRVFARRNLRSDVVVVEVGGGLKWITFRDVFEVDGSPVRDRQARLENLFLQSPATAFDRVQEIVEQSARYNLGQIGRNFNLPTLALAFVHPDSQKRFSFKAGGTKRLDGVEALRLDFQETASPTFIQGRGGRDLFCQGTLWLDPITGRILKSDVKVKDASDFLDAEVKTSFGPWEAQGIWVPTEMWESYLYYVDVAQSRPGLFDRDDPGARQAHPGATTGGASESEYVESLSRYSNFRRFTVDVSEKPN